MIELCSLLKPENILLGIAASSKKRIFEMASQTLGLLYNLDRKEIFDGLTMREKLGSTYLGHGLSLPHCRIKGLDSPKALIIRLNGEIDNGAETDPTSIYFFLLAPMQACEEHLQILAQVADLFSSDKERNKLMTAMSSSEFAGVVSSWCELHSETPT